MRSIVANCGWCGAQNQTLDVVSELMISRDRTLEEGYVTEELWQLVGICRNIQCGWPIIMRGNYFSELSEDCGGIFDFTDLFEVNYCYPQTLSSNIPDHVPPIVRECLLDAAAARTPRASCLSVRSAVEFGLRVYSSEYSKEPSKGLPLGAILKSIKSGMILPESLLNAADQCSAFGNWGSHWSETDIKSEDAEAAFSIACTLLTFLFTLPAQVELARMKTFEARESHKKR